MKPASLLPAVLALGLLGTTVDAGEPLWAFEGRWMQGAECTSPDDATLEYTSGVRSEHGVYCGYDDRPFERVKHIAVNRWEIETECLVPYHFEDEDGEMGRGNRDASTHFELTLDGDRLIERLTVDIDNRPEFPVQESIESEYTRCH